jgi:hypothetical protein
MSTEDNQMQQAVELVSEGKYEEARKLLGKKFSQDDFLSTVIVSPDKKNANMFNFVKGFKNPNWHIYVINHNCNNKLEKALDFVHLAQKNNLDLFVPHNGSDYALMSSIFVEVHNEPEKYAMVLASVDKEHFINFSTSNNPKSFKAFDTLLNTTLSTYEDIKQDGLAPFDILFDKIFTPELSNSENYKKLFTNNSSFVSSLLYNKSSYINTFEKVKKFLGEHAQTIIDSGDVGTIFCNNKLSE